MNLWLSRLYESMVITTVDRLGTDCCEFDNVLKNM